MGALSEDHPRAGTGGKAGKDSEGHRFINRGSGYMLLDNASKVAEPLLVLLCAKAYSGGDWGLFKYYESLALLLTRLASLGLDRGVVWIYSRCDDDAVFVRRFARCANLVFLVSAALFALMMLQHLGYLPDVGGWKNKLPVAPTAQFAMFLASVPLQALTLLFLQSFLNKRLLLPTLLIRNLAVPIAIYGPALLLSLTSLKSTGLALPYLFGNLVGLTLAAATFFRVFGIPLRRWSLMPGASRDLLRFSLPIASTDFFMSFAYRFDLLLLGRYSGIREVEIYSVVTMISNTLRSFRQSFDGIMLSVFSAEGVGRVNADQRRNFNYASWIVTTIQIPFFFLALIFGRELLSLIAPTYAGGYLVLVIACFFNLLITVGAFSGQLLVGLGRTMLIPVAQGGFFLCSVSFNFLLVPRYGAEGAATATGFANLVGGLITFAGIWYYSKSFMLMGRYFAPLAAGFAMLAVPAAIHFWLRPGLAWDAAVFAAGMAAFALHARANWRRFNAPGH